MPAVGAKDGAYTWDGTKWTLPSDTGAAKDLTNSTKKYVSPFISPEQAEYLGIRPGPYPQPEPEPAPAPVAPVSTSSDSDLARANTARTMELLRQGIGRSETSGIESLRRQLASRGLLDSGSLGAGTANIVNEGQGLMARGSMSAANQENQTLLDLLREQRGRQFQKEYQERSIASQENIARLRAEFQRQMQPPWWEGALGSAGQGAGMALGEAGIAALLAIL